MADLSTSEQTSSYVDRPSRLQLRPRDGAMLLGAVVLVALCIWIPFSLSALAADSERFRDSTLGELAVWMADQAQEEAPESWLGRYAQSRKEAIGLDELPPEMLLDSFHQGLVLFGGGIVLLAAAGAVGLFARFNGHRLLLLAALIGLNSLVYLIPIGSGAPIVATALVGVVLAGLLLLFSAEHVERYIGFLVILSFFTVIWEGSKFIASALDYTVSAPVTSFAYDTYPDLDAALTALGDGETDIILADRRDLRDLMAEFPEEDEPLENAAYPDLRYVSDFQREGTRFGRPITPELPGRVAVAVRSDEASEWSSIEQLGDVRVAAIADGFPQTDFLDLSRELVLVDLRIFNNLNLPHLQSIAEALLQPARRNGPLLLVQILWGAALYTLTEALIGFVFGGLLGFFLGSLFAHIGLLRRSLLPYVIASQTIPIIAIAPMIVIWLRDTHPILPVAVISAYLTFFPVTINTLRGLQSPEPTAFDLMTSYAASSWQTMWKLRVPAAMPFIFTALKVSATASVVGAIIGELPSGVRNGLGRAILDFSSDYSLISTPKLWAAILIASLLGISFFLVVTLVERLVIGRFEGKN